MCSDEAKLKREVVNKVARLSPSNDPLEVEQYRVGLNGPAKRCIAALENMGAKTGMLGLVGMGGVGKTTLAREIYNHFVAQKKFRRMTFLEIHRDPSSSNVQICPTCSTARQQLLWDLLRVQGNTSNYSSWFQKVSILGPVLIVVDDVHKLGQFEALIPFATDLHPGSRIIVTSQDRSILNNVAGRTKLDHYLFDVTTLGPCDSNMLFNWHAFDAKVAPKDCKDLAEDVVGACGGLPLALKVIGSSLFDKRSDGNRETIWLEAITVLKQSMDVMGVLQWSYDNLSESEKRMFVDTACLFYGRPTNEAIAYWESCKNCTSCAGGHTVRTSLRNLINKNLIVESFNSSLHVHDLLRDLGQEIGRKAKSHFVNGEIAEAMIIQNQGTNKTMALNLARSPKRKFETEDFVNMPNLHFLVLPDGCRVDGDFRRMSRELRWLQWRSMAFDHVPMGLNMSNLVSLDFSDSTHLAHLWMKSNENLEGCPNLCRLCLSSCTSITELPDSIGRSSRLQYLELVGCNSLRKLPESIGQLKALKDLYLNGCSTLRALPTSIGQLKGLERLHIGGCTRLKALPDTIGGLSNLKYLHSDDWHSVVKIPASIGLLSSIESLAIGGTPEWQTFSGGIGEAWTRLLWLKLYNCGGLGSVLDYGALQSLGVLYIDSRTLTELPESIGLLKRLWDMRISCQRLECLPSSIGDLNRLSHLELSRCDNLKRLPKTLGALTSLKLLMIECCPIRKLPGSIGLLPQLSWLVIKECKNLQKLPTSIRQLKALQEFQFLDCGSIEEMGALTTLQGLPIWGSTSITQLPASLGIVSTLIGYKDNLVFLDAYDLFNGTCQVLEEDESGSLKAYQNESSGVTTLVRSK